MGIFSRIFIGIILGVLIALFPAAFWTGVFWLVTTLFNNLTTVTVGVAFKYIYLFFAIVFSSILGFLGAISE